MTADQADSSHQPAMNPEGFRASPGGHVYGIVDDPEHDVPAVTASLLAACLPLEAMHVYCCQEGVDALETRGGARGLVARITRILQSVTYADHLSEVKKELEAGHALIGVSVDEERSSAVGTILRRCGAHDIVHYGELTWTRLGDADTADG